MRSNALFFDVGGTVFDWKNTVRAEIQSLADALVRATWHRLRVFPGGAEAIKRLRTVYTVVVLTILSWESIVSSSKRAGVEWDGILSCEFLGYYKPSRQAYLRAAYVGVPEEDNVTEGFGASSDIEFDITARDFDELCERLGA
jgi:2-haloacid dehalogenase